MKHIDQDEFDAWRDNAITRWVLEAIGAAAEDKRDAFLSRFFYSSERDAYNAAYLRGEFFALLRISNLKYDEVVTMHESGELEHDIDGTWAPSGRGRQ